MGQAVLVDLHLPEQRRRPARAAGRPGAPAARRRTPRARRPGRRERVPQAGSAVPSSPANPGSGMCRSTAAISLSVTTVELWRCGRGNLGGTAATLTLLGLVWTWVSFRRRGRDRGHARARLHAAAGRGLPDRHPGDVHRDRRVGHRLGVRPGASTRSPGPGSGSAGLRRGAHRGLRASCATASWAGPRHLGDRGRHGSARRRAVPEASSTRSPRQEPVVDDELAEIEALLKKRGIQ